MNRDGLSDAWLIKTVVFGYVLSSLALSGIPSLSRLAAVFAGVLFFLLFVEFVRGRILIDEWVLPVMFFLLYGFLISLPVWEAASELFISTIVIWFGGILVGLAIYNGVNIRIIFFAMALASLANALSVALGFDAYFLYVADLDVESEVALEKRATGLVGNSNVLAFQALLPLFIFSLHCNNVGKTVWIVAIFCAIQALVFTGSRKGLFLAVAYLPYLYLLVRQNRLLLRICVVFLVVLPIVAYFQIDFVRSNAVENVAIERVLLAVEGKDDSYLERVDLVASGLKKFEESPLIGHGFDMFRHVSGHGKYAHNNLIELAVDGGVLYILLFYSIYIYAVVVAIKMYKQTDLRRYFHIALIFILFLLDFGLVSYTQKIWPLLLVLLSLPFRRA